MVSRVRHFLLKRSFQLFLLTVSFYLGGYLNGRENDNFREPEVFCIEKTMKKVESQSLLSLAIKYKPTKFFPYLHTGYHRFYERIFEPLRHKRIKFLEMGLDNGNGSLLWEEYFTNAEFHGIEYSNDRVEDATKKVHKFKIHRGSQENVDFLRSLKHNLFKF